MSKNPETQTPSTAASDGIDTVDAAPSPPRSTTRTSSR
eukprot:CAMPEP_0178602882 /NCGR_PEP_ID=MMETSP0697-20121206/35203_1 /TAXON_ID=265572 /ORGANISM="Extubocellulus spinifer, Strain CCMP396" /LENGTH=37 /DNA_ID= /DNA_START= /DNA_END= /DNA_ORIENTATION=